MVKKTSGNKPLWREKATSCLTNLISFVAGLNDLKVFSNRNYSMLLFYEKQQKRLIFWPSVSPCGEGALNLFGAVQCCLAYLRFSSCFSNLSTSRPNHTERMRKIWGGPNSQWSVKYNVKLRKRFGFLVLRGEVKQRLNLNFCFKFLSFWLPAENHKEQNHKKSEKFWDQKSHQ